MSNGCPFPGHWWDWTTEVGHVCGAGIVASSQLVHCSSMGIHLSSMGVGG